MTHEFKNIVEQAWSWQKEGKKFVLVTVVALEGSSYRKPGVRMLINAEGAALGAVSGGCVEKEVIHQAKSVFETNIPKVISYDGRLRLGCEGVLYMLIEPFAITQDFYAAFNTAIAERSSILVQTYYSTTFGPCVGGGSTVFLNNSSYSLQPKETTPSDLLLFEEELPPLFRLLIIGAEHDAVALCSAAAQLGWQVTVVAPPDEQKSIAYFDGAQQLITPLINALDRSLIDSQVAVVLMTHSYNKDLQYLLALKNTYPAYFGLLGPKKRKEQLIGQFLEFDSDIELEFIDQLRGPAGINIGAASAQEIAVAILAEILAVVRQQEPMPLKDKKGSIHA